MENKERFKQFYCPPNNINFDEHYWNIVKDIIDANGWTYCKQVPHMLDYYFEGNTGINIDFEKNVEESGEFKGSRWRPKAIKDFLDTKK